MKTISLYQPWASLIMDGRKTIETRSWATKYRGLLAIHASQKIDRDAAVQFYGHIAKRYYPLSALRGIFPTGAVLGTTVLQGCVRFPSPLAPPDEYGDFTDGRFGWLLTKVHKFISPIPAKGHQSLWNWEPPAGVIG